ncbi:MAG TPA: PEP-CTERM sorting domain-containing protein [Nonomuraea sp.]|nr:PEP-CTERM sorting domain-containing protein [Nonomuraea sp.]
MRGTQALFTLLGTAALAAATPATALDLLNAGDSGFVNSAFFQQVPNQTTGTGVIEPFLRLQANGTEQGFNTSVNNVLDNKDGIWTHPLLVSDVPVVNLGGTNYFKVLLDINQTGANPLLSLDQLKIYRQATGNISTLGGLTNEIYNLDGAGDTFIRLNYDLNPGSGAGDMFAYIPVKGTGDYFYLYSQFGTLNGSNDGFEEWAKVGVSPPIPEPETYALMMAGLGVMGFVARRRKKAE